jgi:prepilin-type N-terminal cleavage/methylation domain-containing protein
MKKGFTLTNKACSYRPGFTLIELLVVISIIGVLAGLVLVSFVRPQKQTRDVARKSDLKQYQTALETFANTSGGFYPSFNKPSSASTSLCTPLGMTCPGPQDSRYEQDASFSYFYQSNGSDGGVADATEYVLWAKLENKEAYWVICASGQTGEVEVAEWSEPTDGSCPL